MVSPEQSKPEFNKREVFHGHLDIVLNNLERLEKAWERKPTNPNQKFLDLERTKQYFLGDSHYGNVVKDNELLLFARIFNLFSFKHQITEQDKTIAFQAKEKKKGKVVGFLGPIGAGKSTLAEAVAKKIQKPLAMSEPHLVNPFWKAQQEDSKKYDEFMLRSQIFFLLYNISAGIDIDILSRFKPGIFISDTSIFNDIYEFVEWYAQIGKFDRKECLSYQRLVELFKPIIPKPDLLVAVNADTPEHLIEGIRNRRKDSPARNGEVEFSDEELRLQIALTGRTIETLYEEWQIETLLLTVNPLRFNKANLDKHYLQQQVRQIISMFRKFNFIKLLF